MYIYIAMEIKARELEARAFLAAVAAERGHKVILGGKEDTRSLASKGILPPGILHDKSMGSSRGKDKVIRGIVDNGHIFTGQVEESGLLDESFDRIARTRYHTDTLEKSTYSFCWGEHDYSSLIRNYPELSDKFIISGSPRVDLWRRDFNPYAAECRDRAADIGEYILIATNFKTVLNQNPFWNGIAERREKGKYLQAEEAEFEVYDKAAWQLRMIAAYIKAIRRLARQYPDLNFVFRPHPIENMDAWLNMIGDLKNVRITRIGGASSWIRGAKALIHNSCTTAMEAAVCGVPVISYRPIKSCHEHPIPNSAGIEVETEEELVNIVNKISNSKEAMPYGRPGQAQEGHDAIHKRFSNIEGRFAADIIVDHWEAAGQKLRDDQGRFKDVRKYYFSKLLKSPLTGMVLYARDISKKRAYDPKSHKLKHLTRTEVEQLIGNYGAALGRFSGIRVTQLGQRSVLIEKDHST